VGYFKEWILSCFGHLGCMVCKFVLGLVWMYVFMSVHCLLGLTFV
jgi:hypothetical protein